MKTKIVRTVVAGLLAAGMTVGVAALTQGPAVADTSWGYSAGR